MGIKRTKKERWETVEEGVLRTGMLSKLKSCNLVRSYVPQTYTGIDVKFLALNLFKI